MPTWFITYQAKIYTALALLVVLSITGWAVYQWGKAEGKNDCLKNQVIEVIAEAKLSTEADKKISDVAARVAKLIGIIDGNSAAGRKAIEDYVKNNPRFIDCSIDDDAVRVWNSENKNEGTGVPTGAGNTVSGPPPPN